MAQASEKSVLGNFNNAKFNYAGLTSTFFKRAGKFFVNTDGRDGKLTDHEIKYTFGVILCSNISLSFLTAGCRRSPSPGTRARRKKAASAGFISTPMSG